MAKPSCESTLLIKYRIKISGRSPVNAMTTGMFPTAVIIVALFLSSCSLPNQPKSAHSGSSVTHSPHLVHNEVVPRADSAPGVPRNGDHEASSGTTEDKSVTAGTEETASDSRASKVAKPSALKVVAISENKLNADGGVAHSAAFQVGNPRSPSYIKGIVLAEASPSNPKIDHLTRDRPRVAAGSQQRKAKSVVAFTSHREF